MDTAEADLHFPEDLLSSTDAERIAALGPDQYVYFGKDNPVTQLFPDRVEEIPGADPQADPELRRAQYYKIAGVLYSCCARSESILRRPMGLHFLNCALLQYLLNYLLFDC